MFMFCCSLLACYGVTVIVCLLQKNECLLISKTQTGADVHKYTHTHTHIQDISVFVALPLGQVLFITVDV